MNEETKEFQSELEFMKQLVPGELIFYKERAYDTITYKSFLKTVAVLIISVDDMSKFVHDNKLCDESDLAGYAFDILTQCQITAYVNKDYMGKESKFSIRTSDAYSLYLAIDQEKEFKQFPID